MGLHQIVYKLYDTTVEDNDFTKEMCLLYLELLLNYHRDKMIGRDINITKTDEIYKEYLDDWNKLVAEKAKEIKEYAEEMKDECNYVI